MTSTTLLVLIMCAGFAVVGFYEKWRLDRLQRRIDAKLERMDAREREKRAAS